MLSHSRCLTRNFGRSLSAIRQGNNVLARRATAALSASHSITFNNTVKSDPRSSIFQIQYFRTSVAYRDEVVTVKTPAFAESVTEGDVRWEKGNSIFINKQTLVASDADTGHNKTNLNRKLSYCTEILKQNFLFTAVGDSVSEDEVVCEIETDKTSVQVPSPAAGVIEELLIPDGGKVEGGTPLFKLRKGAGAPKAAEPPKAEAPAAEAPPPPSAAPPPPPPPSAVGPIPTTMPPVPPVPAHAMDTKPVSAIKPTAAPAAPVAQAEGGAKGARTESRVKMNRMRLRIAQRLKEAQNTCAMLTTFNEVDMSNISEMRKAYKDAFLKKHNIKLGFMSAFVKAAAYALSDQPAVNAVIDDTTKEIVYRDYVDISVAVATPKGLVVPVIRNVEGMNFADIEKAINLLGEKARKNELAVEDMDGGTFTISNGGVFGSMFGTPIINPPQSAILGMHGIFDRPVAVGGKVRFLSVKHANT
uniref:Dihydrolipoyllysine-residue succinyltransferase component of 2-oxoglutarate dehydrogenase complex, mitochondrial n=1 Tax=Seriola lalandi dorsalis TaxID=1841481 RepID=A0A3B4YHA5_SERLL